MKQPGEEHGGVAMKDGRAYFTGITATDLAGDVTTQTREALANVEARLSDAGMTRRQILVVHIWLSDMALFQAMTSVWNEWVDADDPPSRSCVSGQPAMPGALLEVDVTACVSNSDSDIQAIERYAIVKGPGRPTMCLGIAAGDWFTVCMIAPDCSVGVAGQTQQLLGLFDDFLKQAGTDKSRLASAEIWLKNLDDTAIVEPIWQKWAAPAEASPSVRFVRADMAQPAMLIEIRITASR